MNWFKDTFGFEESEGKLNDFRSNFIFDKEKNILTSLKNQKIFYVGKFITPTLNELRSKTLEEILNLNEEKIEKSFISSNESEGKLENILEKKNEEKEMKEIFSEKNDGRKNLKENNLLFEEQKSKKGMKDQSKNKKENLTFEKIYGDVRSFITNPKNLGAIFQVASQFNCLEMVGPKISPEDGITRYIYDQTQGPACAILCPAATLFRNYFWNGSGQTRNKQLNLLDKIEEILLEDGFKNKNPEDLKELEAEKIGIEKNNHMKLANEKEKSTQTEKKENPYWKMKNGYCLFDNEEQLKKLDSILKTEIGLIDKLRQNFKVGIQYETEVNLNDKKKKNHRITQIFCSALPISYCHFHAPKLWETFAYFILECSYDATLTFANKLAEAKKDKNSRVKVYLTSIGGGAFGNSSILIEKAMNEALEYHKNDPLDVYLIEYR